MSIHPFGQMPDSTAISEIRLTNAAGARASILTFGATLHDLVVPLPDGEMRRVVLGFDRLESYFENHRFLGATVGRHASRIDRGHLELDGKTYQLSLNPAGVHLHGGVTGFSRKPWTIVDADDASVTLALHSPDGDDGYPGALDVRCTVRLLEPATLAVTMTATTNAPTIVSLAHHSYFTLQPGTSIRDHKLQVNATRTTPFGADMVPTGAMPEVSGTPYDFRALRLIADPAGDPDFTYDCNFVLDREQDSMVFAARLQAPDDSLRMDVHTTEPCVVFYDGAGLDADIPGLDGARHFPHAALCLEPMRYPDNPNQPAFPSARLDPGETYRQETEYRFSVPAR